MKVTTTEDSTTIVFTLTGDTQYMIHAITSIKTISLKYKATMDIDRNKPYSMYDPKTRTLIDRIGTTTFVIIFDGQICDHVEAAKEVIRLIEGQ